MYVHYTHTWVSVSVYIWHNFLVKCQQEYFNLFSDESTEKQLQWLLIRFFVVRCSFSFFILGFSSVVNIFRVHPQLLQITDFSITIYFDMYFYAISRQFVVRAQPKAAASAPKTAAVAAPAASFISPHSLSLSLSPCRFLQRGICIINCQQCHKIFSLVFSFISLPSTSSSLLFFFCFRDSFGLFYFCFTKNI